MKKALLFLLLFLPLRAAGQNTTISSTMTDTDGTIWAGAFWKIDFRPNASTPNESSYRLLNGQPLSTAVTHQTGSLNGAGAFTMVIYDSTLVVPTGSGWTLTLCSLTSAACGVYQFTSAGSTMDISKNLTTAISAPRFPPTAGAYGYADVEVQTSINQGAMYWNVLLQTNRIWNGTTWVSGGGAGFPGVSSDNNNGIIVQGAVTTSSLPGYRQNNVNARSRNRDEILQLTVTPQDMPGCQFSGRGLLDDRPCFTAAIAYLASTDDNVQRKLLVPFTQNGYVFRTPGYQQILPFDFGDYHGFAGYATQAAAQVQTVNGAVTSCTVTGGTLYAPNANLPLLIQDPSLAGSGAYATVQTNAAGTPTGCTVVLPGMNYPSSGVVVSVMPLGGDGAAATASLSGGTFTSGTITTTSSASGQITNQGSGYSLASSTGMPTAIPLSTLSCTGAQPTFTSTIANGVVTQVTITAPPSGTCTYGGLSTANVPIAFGASCSEAGAPNGLCSNIAPETPVSVPCAVALVNNLTIEGIGNPTINGNWPLYAGADTNSMIAFCEPTGSQSNNITLKGFTVDNSAIGFYFPFYVTHLVTDALNFNNNVGLPIYAYSFGGAYSNVAAANGINTYIQPMSTIRDMRNNGYAGIVCGGAWAGRGNQNGATNGSNTVGPGSYQSLLSAAYYGAPSNANGMAIYGHYRDGSANGRCSIRVVNYLQRATAGSGVGLPKLDQFFEQYIWKTQNGPTTINTSAQNLSNGLKICATPLLPVTDRTIDYQFGSMGAPNFSNNYPWYQCYAPIVYSSFIFNPRYSAADLPPAQDSTFDDINIVTAPTRPALVGRFDYATVRGLNIQSLTYTDPYQVAGQTYGAVSTTSENVNHIFLEDAYIAGSGFTSAVQSYYAGSPSIQGIYVRNAYGFPDQIPYVGSLTSTAPPTGYAPATLNLLDTNYAYSNSGTGYGSGGAILFSANPGATLNNVAAIKGSYTNSTTAPTTTGSINSGSPNLTVANGLNFNNGETLTVTGAGASGANLVTTISSGGGTVNLVLAANAATTVTGAAVTGTGGVYGDLVFYTRGIFNSSLVEAARFQYAGNLRLLKPEISSGSTTNISGCGWTNTTGTIINGTNALTVASATGFANAGPITVFGAGINGSPLSTTVTSGGGTTSLVLAANASTSIVNANVINTTAIGGAGAGKFTSQITGACTVVITPGGATVSGFRCSGADVGPGNPGNALTQTATVAASCTISGTTTSGDSVTWQALAFQ